MLTIFRGGTIVRAYRLSPSDDVATDAHAIAIEGGRVVAVDADAERLADDPATSARVIDLAGDVIAPAFGDGHIHPRLGGLEATGPSIRDAGSVAEIVSRVREWADAHPELEWIVGASYDATLAPDGLFDARWLDEAVPDRPVLLRAWDYHTMWVNSAALAAAGITAQTPEPALGRIVRRPDGTPLGTLMEPGACDLVADVAPRPSDADVRAAFRGAGERLLAEGIGWVQDAWAEPADLEEWLALARDEAARDAAAPAEQAPAEHAPVEPAPAGHKPAAPAPAEHAPVEPAPAAPTALAFGPRADVAQRADPIRWREQLKPFAANRDRFAAIGGRITATTVKFFVDGIIESRTAALLDDYADAPGERGLPNWSSDELAEAATAFDAAGLRLHFHAIGDAAARAAVGAVREVRRRNGERDRRPVIAHLQLVDASDIAEFRDNGIVANFEPLWAKLDDVMRELTFPRLGPERAAQQYRIRSFVDAGVEVSFGSDWPVTDSDPRAGIATAVHRHGEADAGGPAGADVPPEAWLPEERLELEAALAVATRGCAFQAGGDATGRLDPGARADFVRFDRDPRGGGATGLRGARLLETWVAGVRRFPA